MNETILFLNEIIVKPNDKEDSQERIDRVRARVNSSMILNLTVLWCPFLKMGQPRPLFRLFLSFRTENLSSQQDSNSDRRSRRQEH